MLVYNAMIKSGSLGQSKLKVNNNLRPSSLHYYYNPRGYTESLVRVKEEKKINIMSVCHDLVIPPDYLLSIIPGNWPSFDFVKN